MIFAAYDWAGGTEAMLRFGPADGPVVVAALPLFEEANRVRALTVSALRILAERGIAGILPDLPGQGESLVATGAMTLGDLRAAFAAACTAEKPRAVHIASIRSGALIDTDAKAASRWRLAPQGGAELVREMERIRSASRLAGHDAPTIEIAGNRIGSGLMSELSAAEASAGEPIRTLVLSRGGDERPSIEGPPLWRRSEPDNDIAFAARIAEDIARWIASCGA